MIRVGTPRAAPRKGIWNRPRMLSGPEKGAPKMCCICEGAKRFADWGMDRWKRFTAVDAAVFKVCLLSVGALFGAAFAKPLKKWKPLLLIAAVASYTYIIWRMVAHER